MFLFIENGPVIKISTDWIPAPHFLVCLDQWIPLNGFRMNFSNYYINFVTSLLKNFLWSIRSAFLIWPNSFFCVPRRNSILYLYWSTFFFFSWTLHSPICLSFARWILRYLIVFVLSGIFLLYYPMDYYWCLGLYHQFLYIDLLSINLLTLFKLKWLKLETIKFSV